MALSILDGNQSATTLSTIVTSGQHIPAHTVVSLGTQAISNITSAVSGSSVTFGLVGGTVTANNFTLTNVLQYDGSHYFLKVGGVATTGGTSFPVYVAGSVTANPTGTQTIAGTVTANLDSASDSFWGSGNSFATAVQAGLVNYVENESPFPISGTVTANLNTPNFVGTEGDAPPLKSVALGFYSEIEGEFRNVNDTGNKFPISGTVTIDSALPTGTNRIGVVTIGGGTVTIGAGTAQIGSVTASISGTVPISISSVTVGNSVTIGSLPAISGTVTANTFALQGTAVTTSNFTSTTASTVLASFNATREVLTIFNEGAGNLHICAGATCTTIAYQVRLSAGDYYEVPNHQTTITHSAVYATAGTARVTEVI
jgi:hypothetical protein